MALSGARSPYLGRSRKRGGANEGNRLRRGRCCVCVCGRPAGRGRRRDLLQLPAAMGRLGLDAQGDQDRPRPRCALRQQEFRPGAFSAARGKEQPRRRHRLFRRDVRHQRQGGGRIAALQAERLGADSCWTEGSGRLLAHHPLRNARPVRQQGRARGQARTRLLARSVEAGLSRHGRLSRPILGRGRVCRRRRRQSRARRSEERFRRGHRLLPRARQERCDRAEADFLRARGFRRDSDPVRLRFQRLPGEVHREGRFRVRAAVRRLGRVPLRHRPRQRRAAQRARRKDARLHSLRQRPGHLDQRLFAAGAAHPASRRSQGSFLARQRLRARKDGRLGRDGNVRDGIRGPLPRRSALMSVAARFRLHAGKSHARAFAVSGTAFSRLCLVPLAIVVAAFFLLPMARLMEVGADGPKGLAAYAAILIEPRYRATLINTVVLAAATTAATLIIATIAGLFLQRNRFPGHSLLVAMLTFPLAFPGVVVILLAGRQGLIGDISFRLTGGKLVFAYSLGGLFLGYLYFSIPRVILTIMAAVEKLDPRLEEAARSLGAGPWAVHRDVILPALAPAFVASGAIAFATAMGAFGTAFTLATNIDVLAMLIYTEFTLAANLAMAAALSVGLGLVAWAILALARSFAGTTVAAAG